VDFSTAQASVSQVQSGVEKWYVYC
jgi:hypothetical protein